VAIGVPLALVCAALTLAALLRFSFLAYCSAVLFASFDSYAVLGDLSAWYSSHAWLLLALLAALAVYSFWTALAGRPLLGDPEA